MSRSRPVKVSVESEAGGSSEAESSPSHQSVVVASFRPPFLSVSADLNGYLQFLQKFKSYQRHGGQIKLRDCIADGCLVGLPESSSEEELRSLLDSQFAPRSRVVASKIFKSQKSFVCPTLQQFRENRFREFVIEFSLLLEICSKHRPPVKKCMEYFRNLVQPKEFRDYLVMSGLEECQFESFQASVLKWTDEFGSFVAVADAINALPQPAKATSATSSVPTLSTVASATSNARSTSSQVVTAISSAQSSPSPGAAAAATAGGAKSVLSRDICVLAVVMSLILRIVARIALTRRVPAG